MGKTHIFKNGDEITLQDNGDVLFNGCKKELAELPSLIKRLVEGWQGYINKVKLKTKATYACKSIDVYVTPYGRFPTSIAAAKADEHYKHHSSIRRNIKEGRPGYYLEKKTT